MTEATETGWTGGFARGSAVLAVLTVQVVAFSLAYAADVPTLYAVFAVLSAVGIAFGVDAGVVGAAAAALASVLVLALGLPLATFVVRQDPALLAEKAADPGVHRMLYLSVYAPLLAAGVTVTFGVPLAYLLSRGFPGQAIVESLVDLPLVIPHSVAGLLILFGFGRGAAFPFVEVLGTIPGLVLALTFVSAPYGVNAAREAFEAVDRRVVYAARIHGAGPLSTFLRVTAPLSARGILTGGVLTWARAVSEFGAVAVVAYTVEFFYPGTLSVESGRHAPVFIYTTYLSEGLADAGAVASLLLLLSGAIFLVIRKLAYDDGGIL